MGFFRRFVLAGILVTGFGSFAEQPPDATHPLTVRSHAVFTPHHEMLLQIEAAGAAETPPDWEAAFPGAVVDEARSTPAYEWRELRIADPLPPQGFPAALPMPRLGDASQADYLDEEIIVELPPGYAVAALPDYREVQNRFFLFRRTVQADGNRITEHTTLERHPGWDNPSLPGYREALAELTGEMRQQIIVDYRPTPEPGAGWILARDQKAVIRDRNTLELTTSIRRQIGEKAETLWQGTGADAETPPELVALTVTGADGKTKPAEGKWEALPSMHSDSPVPDRQKLIRNDFVLTIPGIQPTDQADFTVRQTIPLDQPAFTWHAGDAAVAIAKDSFELTFPREMTIALGKTPPGVVATSKMDSGTLTLRWEAANPRPEEITLPVGIGSYADYASALLAEVARCTEEQPQAAALAREIAGNVASEADQVRLLRNAVAAQITLMPGVERLRFADLRQADDTLKIGNATPFNRTLLLASMLDALNIHAEVVAVSDRYAVELSDAEWNVFTPIWCDLLIRIVPEDGSPEYYVGDGDEYTPIGCTAWDGCIGLDLTGRTLNTIQVAEELKSRSEWGLRLELDGIGGARLHWRKRYHGLDYARRKQWLETADADARAGDFTEQVSHIAPDAGVVQPIAYAFDGYPGEESFVLELTDWTRTANNTQYAELPGLGEFLRIPELLLRTGRPGYWNGTLDYTVVLPPVGQYQFTGFPAEEFWTIPANGGEMSFSSSAASPNEWKATAHVSISPVKWQSADFPALGIGRQILGKLRQPVVFFEQKR